MKRFIVVICAVLLVAAMGATAYAWHDMAGISFPDTSSD
jgi:hypothetical protein